MAQTTAEILQAAEDLAASGERVSVRSVRAKLGGGDPGTIGRVLRERRENAAVIQAAKAQQPALPDVLSRALVDWAGSLVADQARAARADLADTNDDNDALLAQVEELKAQIADLNATITATRQERDTNAGALNAVQKQVEEQAAACAAERARNAELDQRLASQQAQILAAEEVRREIAELRAENQRLIEQAATANAALKAATDRAETAEQKAEQADQRAHVAEQDAAAARAEAAAARATATAAEQTAAAAESRAERAQDEARQLLAALTATRPADKEAMETTPETKTKRRRKTKTEQADEVESLHMFPGK